MNEVSKLIKIVRPGHVHIPLSLDLDTFQDRKNNNMTIATSLAKLTFWRNRLGVAGSYSSSKPKLVQITLLRFVMAC